MSTVGPRSRAFDRRRFLLLSAAAAAHAALPPAVQGSASPPDAPVRWTGYDGALVIDALGGIGDEEGPLSAEQLSAVRTSGVTAINLTVGVPGSREDVFELAFRSIGYWEQAIESHPDALMKVRSAADLERARASHRLGIIYGFQDATPFGADASRVELFSRLA